MPAMWGPLLPVWDQFQQNYGRCLAQSRQAGDPGADTIYERLLYANDAKAAAANAVAQSQFYRGYVRTATKTQLQCLLVR
jgi:hypothetical protein